MNRIRTLPFVTLVLSFAGTVAAQHGDARFDDAMARYEIGHYEAAFDMFAALADGGHCEAARIAHQMARHGRALYALEFKLEPERAQRWARRGACPVTSALR